MYWWIHPFLIHWSGMPHQLCIKFPSFHIWWKGYFWPLHSDLLVHVLTNVVISHSVDCYNFTISLHIWIAKSLPFSPSENVLVILGLWSSLKILASACRVHQEKNKSSSELITSSLTLETNVEGSDIFIILSLLLQEHSVLLPS